MAISIRSLGFNALGGLPSCVDKNGTAVAIPTTLANPSVLKYTTPRQKNNQVGALQCLLMATGFRPRLRPDGVTVNIDYDFGRTTESEVKAFQRSKGLSPVDGQVGNLTTWPALRAAASNGGAVQPGPPVTPTTEPIATTATLTDILNAAQRRLALAKAIPIPPLSAYQSQKRTAAITQYELVVSMTTRYIAAPPGGAWEVEEWREAQADLRQKLRWGDEAYLEATRTAAPPPTVTCPKGQRLVGSTCVPVEAPGPTVTCPAGQRLVGSVCVPIEASLPTDPICGPGEILVAAGSRFARCEPVQTSDPVEGGMGIGKILLGVGLALLGFRALKGRQSSSVQGLSAPRMVPRRSPRSRKGNGLSGARTVTFNRGKPNEKTVTFRT
ncbi:MAG: peptidoglycan-binding protein [Verrucomicrobiota bacterium]